MGRYVIRRLLQMIPVFVGSTFLIFVMVYALGDPVAALFGDRAPDPATAARLFQRDGVQVLLDLARRGDGPIVLWHDDRLRLRLTRGGSDPATLERLVAAGTALGLSARDPS